MTLPAQIQKQIDDAKAIIEQQYGDKKPAADETTAPAAEGSAPASATQESAAPAATQTEQAPPQESSATSVEDENSQTYAQRWRSLHGVYNSTQRRLTEANQRIANLEQLVSSMQSMAAAPQQATQPSKLVTDTDVTEYGSDMVDFARRVAREENAQLHGTIQALQQQIAQLQGVAPVVQRVAANQQEMATQTFAERLTRQVPDWTRINDDPRFHEWLLTPDAMTGITRQVYLSDAEQALDLGRVVSIFQAWKREAGIAPAPAAATPAAPAAPSAASKLEKQIAPGRASAATQAPAQKAEKQYTRADIAKFYADKLRGVYKGREAEAAATERDIFLAQREGRVVPNAA